MYNLTPFFNSPCQQIPRVVLVHIVGGYFSNFTAIFFLSKGVAISLARVLYSSALPVFCIIVQSQSIFILCHFININESKDYGMTDLTYTNV